MRAASTSAPGPGDAGCPSFDDKVRFLSDPAHYAERTTRVTLRETNHAWLFMTDRHVFKMKKPFRLGGFDYSTLESRRWLCREELRLNRRLANNTYLDVVALVQNERGEIEFAAGGRVVEWLVKMVRMADSQALPEAAARQRVPPDEIRKLMRKLRRFYSRTAIVDIRPGDYVTRLREKAEYWSTELLRSQSGLPATSVNDLLARQVSYIDTHCATLQKRAKDGRIRDGHGDLRPEHIFLIEDAEPEIIDCLEFDPELRRLDSAEEIAFLAMQCRHEGFDWLATQCFDCYREEFGHAAAPSHLWNFYASLGAAVRAGLATWRIVEAADIERWRRRAGLYLNDALHYISEAKR